MPVPMTYRFNTDSNRWEFQEPVAKQGWVDSSYNAWYYGNDDDEKVHEEIKANILRNKWEIVAYEAAP